MAQEFGLAGDVCPMPEAELGVSIDDDAPILGACAVQCNTTCDGSLMSNGGIAKRLELEDGIPIFQLAAPLRHREDDVQDYAAQEIRNCIAFIEEKTGEKWDWKYYFECAKRVNESTRHRMEWLDRIRPIIRRSLVQILHFIPRQTTWQSVVRCRNLSM